MELPLDVLRTLAAAVDEGTLDAAATRLGITPSAVSQRIKTIEQRVGRIVLQRSKPVQPTEHGVPLLRLARQLLVLEHDTLHALGVEAPSPRVAIAVNADSLSTWLLPALAPVLDNHEIAFEFIRADEDRTTELLESGTVIGAVTARAHPVSGCVATALGAEEYVPIASRAFAARWFAAGVTTAALDASPWIDFDRDDDMQRRFADHHAAVPVGPRHLIGGSTEMVDAVRLGFGWAMAMRSQFDEDPEIVVLDGPSFAVPLYWQRWNLASPLLDELTTALIRGAARALRAPRRTETGPAAG